MEISRLVNARYINDGNDIYVEAIIEDAVCVSRQTYLDPPEYGPGLFSTTILDEDLPVGFYPSEEELVECLSSLDLTEFSWVQVDTSDES